jgi:hypothetical protein
MALGIEAIIWYLVLIDAIFANLTVLFWKKWWNKKKWRKWLPLTGWWTLLYLVIVAWLGYALFRLGIIF